MTRSVVLVLYYLFILRAHCRSQGNYIIHTVTPSSENDSNSTTYYVPLENSVKFSRKTSSEKASTIAIRPVYRPATVTSPVDQNEITQRTNTSAEYSSTLEDRFASTEGSRRPAQTVTTSSADPNKFAVPYTDRNQVFSETLYREKICKNQPTCDMVKLAPEELTSLGTRNCMCDEDCRKYGDCCLDSPYYNATEQLLNYQSFFCSEQELVYMVTTCPRNFVISSVKDKCGYFDYESADHDLSLMTPVSSSKYRVTFANSYCAICNGLESFDKWQLELKCHSLGPVEEQTTPKVSTTSSSSLVIFPGSNRKKRLQVVRKKSVQLPQTEPNAKEAAKYAIYDPKKKAFFSTYNGENYKCVYKRNAPDNLKKSVRYCYPAIDSCSDFSNRTLVEQCKFSATTIVYNKVKYYRNPECALCNKVKDAEPLGCFDLGNRIGASSIFMTGGNKAPPKFCGGKVC